MITPVEQSVMSERLLDQLASITSFPNDSSSLAGTAAEAIPVPSGLLAHLLTFLQGQFVSKLHRQQLELDASREQVQVASQRLNVLRSQLRVAESSALESSSKVSALESRCSALEASYGKERTGAKQAAQELQSTLDAFASFRRQQAEQSSQLRAQLESAQFEAQTAKAEAERLDAQCKTLTRQLTALQDAHAQLKAESRLKESRFVAEMDAKERLVQAYAQAAQSASQRAMAVEDEIEGVRGAVVESEADLDGKQEEWRVQLVESNQRCKQLQVDVDRLQSALNSLIASTAESSGASTAVEEAKVVALEVQLERTKEALEEAVRALEANEPRIRILTEDNARLQGEIVALTETVIAGAAVKEEMMHLRRQLDGAIGEGRTLVQENADLAKQVQGLLAELEGRRLRASQSSASGVMDSATLITERLVDFNSIATLQARNQELLKALRSTCAKMEALESATAASETVPRAQLDEALRELAEVREARLKQAALVDRFLNGKIDESEPVTTQVKVVEIVKEAPVPVVAPAPAPVSNEFEIKCAHLEAQLEVAQERAKFSQQSLEALKADHSALQERFTAQQGTLQFLQSQGERAAAELATLQDRDAHLQGQVSSLRAQAGDLQAALTRVQAAHDAAVSERDRLSALIPPLQSMLTDHEASEAALKKHFDAQLSFMERELQATRKQLSDSTASHAQILSQIEGERSELLRRLEAVMQEAHAYKQSSIQLEVQASGLAAQVQELESVLKTAASKELDQDQQANKVSELKLRALAGQVKELKEANAKGEAQLVELQAALAAKEAEVEQTRSEFASVSERLTQAISECEALQAQIQSKNAEVESIRLVADQVPQLESEIARLSQVKAALESENQDHLQTIEARLDELAALKTSLANTQSTLQEVEAQLNVKGSALAASAKETESLRSELLSLRQENSALMDELAQQTPQEHEGEFDALQPTIPNDSRLLQLLRADKDKLIAEKDELTAQCSHLQAQLDQLQATLNAERSSVSTQAADYARLLQQIEEFQSKAAEGIKARLQVDQLRKQLAEAQQSAGEMATGSEALERAQAELRVLNEIVGERDAELTKLRAEGEVLKQNAANLKKMLMESKLNSAKEIDALKRELAGVEALKRDYAAVKGELDARLQQEAETEEHLSEIQSFMQSMHQPQQQQRQMNTGIQTIVIESGTEQDSEVDDESDIAMSSEVESADEHVDEHEHVDDNEEVEDEEKHAQSDEDVESEAEDENEHPMQETQSGAVLESEASMHDDSHESKLGNDEVESSIHDENASIASTTTAPVIQAPSLTPQQKPQQIRKVVSLVGITSSTASAQSTAAPASMITSASGKKFVPVTAPEPIARKPASSANASITANANTNASSPASSPSSASNQQQQRNKKKKKKNPVNNAGVGKNVRRNN